MPQPSALATLKTFHRRQRRMPSYGEMATLFGYRSRNAAVKLARKLITQGVLSQDSTGKLVPGRRFHDVPVLGFVEAGFPSPAEEELLDTMSLEEWLIDNQEATYLLKVQGDSMIEAGILPGDVVLVERVDTATPGDIVIAQIDREYTMKYLRRKHRRFYLEPANKKYQPLYPTQELNIVAVVKAVIRKY